MRADDMMQNAFVGLAGLRINGNHWIAASVMDKPNSCVVANTQIKPGISRQVRAMRKLEYVRFISLSPGGGPNSREIIMNESCLSLIAIIVGWARLHSNPGSEPLFRRPPQSPRTTKARPVWHGSPPPIYIGVRKVVRAVCRLAAALHGSIVMICFTDACRVPLALGAGPSPAARGEATEPNPASTPATAAWRSPVRPSVPFRPL
jgi:hypothetical protein